MNLRTLSSTKSLRGVRVLVRVDWNVPRSKSLEPEASLKIARSLETIEMLRSRGAIVIAMTHLGRPKGVEPQFSTKHLLPVLKRAYKAEPIYRGISMERVEEVKRFAEELRSADPGSLYLLENVRFWKGEETNAKSLSKAYALLGDLFVNEAFASCHRAHASVAGIAGILPSYAGPGLVQEVQALERIWKKPKSPFVAIVGGAKLSTKLPVIEALIKKCDRVLLGGAMANTFVVASGYSIGASLAESDFVPAAKRLLKSGKLLIPVDVVVKTSARSTRLRRALVTDIGSKESVADLGPRTLRIWSEEIRMAKTILWNGPVGITEVRETGAGSRFIARVAGSRSRGEAYGVAGGGDTIPCLVETKTTNWFDHVSMGGGAMLEFFIKQGKLPGLLPLERS